jgi:hypothetical protein
MAQRLIGKTVTLKDFKTLYAIRPLRLSSRLYAFGPLRLILYLAGYFA